MRGEGVGGCGRVEGVWEGAEEGGAKGRARRVLDGEGREGASCAGSVAGKN